MKYHPLANKSKLLSHTKGLKVCKRHTKSMKMAIGRVDNHLVYQYCQEMKIDSVPTDGEMDYYLFERLHEDLQNVIEEYTAMLGPVYDPERVKAIKLNKPVKTEDIGMEPEDGFYLIEWKDVELEDSWEPVADWHGHQVVLDFWERVQLSVAERSVNIDE
jgi:hypothetical protein